jgi:hypothetical protein
MTFCYLVAVLSLIAIGFDVKTEVIITDFVVAKTTNRVSPNHIMGIAHQN